jgi:aminopeptidase N
MSRQRGAGIRNFLLSAAIVVLGVGAGLALGYGGFSYTSRYMSSGEETDWRSEVQLRVMSPANADIDSRVLQNRMQYYIARAQTMPFLTYLSDKIAQEKPEYKLTADELSALIKIQTDDFTSAPVTNYRVIVTTANQSQTEYLVVRMPQAFKDFMIEEATTKAAQQYQDLLKDIESTKAALVQANHELNALIPSGVTGSVELSSDYVVVSAKLKGLQERLDLLTTQVAALTQAGKADDPAVSALTASINETTAAVVKAQQQLSVMRGRSWDGNNPVSLQYKMAQDKVTNLDQQLTKLVGQRDALQFSKVDLSTITDYLVVERPSAAAHPAPLLKLSTALIGGAVVGAIVAWIVIASMLSRAARRRELRGEE